MTMHVVISGWLLGDHSGANRRLIALVERTSALLTEGERVTVLHHRDFEPPRAAATNTSWRAIDVPRGPAWRRALAERRVLPRVLRELGATVLDHGFLPLPRVPVATCLLVHDVRAAVGLTRWPSTIARAVLRRSCRRADAVVVPSDWTAECLRALGALGAASERLVVVPNGIDLPTPPTSIAPSDWLLHVGHLEPRKNVDVVVRALARIPADRRPPLWLAGRDAGAGAHLRRLADHAGVAVRFLGEVTDGELLRLVAAARAIVVPSLHEGFGFPALEGLAHGRPVLASDAGALREVCGDQGTLLPPRDADAWARAIESLPADTETLRSDRRARAARFDWGTAAQRLVAVWRDVHTRRQRMR